MRWISVIGSLLLVLGLSACDGGNVIGTPDGGGSDGGQNVDGGDPDSGDPDGSDTDGGDPDGGDPDGSDPLAGLDPIDPQCEDHQGPAEACWEEWLKIVGDVQFSPVERGELGAGPWPTTSLERWGAAEGLDGNILYVGTDTGQNIYAVNREALFVRRPGETRFSRYARGTNGIRDYALLSVAGHGPGVAFIGLDGYYDSSYDPENPWAEPEAARLSGDLMRIDLTAGGITATRYRTHNSNTPGSGKFDHSRQIFNIVVPKRGLAAGEVFLGTEHGAVRYQGELYADHVHIDTVIDLGDGRTTQRFGPAEAIHVTEDGVMWFGNDFQVAARPFSYRRYEWYRDRWLFPSRGFGAHGERNYFRGIGVDTRGVVYAGARTFGIARIHTNDRGRVDQLAVPDSRIRDLVVDLDDTVWLATDGGLFRYEPSSGSWTQLAGVPGLVHDIYIDDTVEPRALYIAHNGGLSIYRGP